MDSKEQYQVFKFFKNTYTKINSAKTIKILPTLDIVLEGCKNEEFFLFGGKILEENALFKHLKDNNLSAEITIEQWQQLAKCLKKNIKSLDISPKLVVFSFKDDAENDKCIELELCPENRNTEKWLTINPLLPASKINITSIIDSEIIEVYEKNGLLTNEHTNIKIIEIPKNRVLSIQKDRDIFLRYSPLLPNGIKYVAISSSGDALELEQIFATL